MRSINDRNVGGAGQFVGSLFLLPVFCFFIFGLLICPVIAGAGTPASTRGAVPDEEAAVFEDGENESQDTDHYLSDARKGQPDAGRIHYTDHFHPPKLDGHREKRFIVQNSWLRIVPLSMVMAMVLLLSFSSRKTPRRIGSARPGLQRRIVLVFLV